MKHIQIKIEYSICVLLFFRGLIFKNWSEETFNKIKGRFLISYSYLIFNLSVPIYLQLFSSQFQVPEQSIAPRIGMSFNNYQEIPDLPKLSHKKTKLKGSVHLTIFSFSWTLFMNIKLYILVFSVFDFLPLFKWRWSSNLVAAYEVACEEGPGLFAHLLTFLSLLIIVITLPISLVWVVKVVQESN